MAYRPTEASALPIEQLGPFLAEAKQDALYYFNQLWSGWQLKGAIGLFASSCSVFYGQVFYGNWVLFCLWALFVTMDSALGAAVAVKNRKFTMARFRKFVVKVCAHVAIIALVGSLNHSFSQALGSALPITDWFLCVLLCTEALSIIVNMEKLNLPVPGVARRLVAAMDTRAQAAMESCLHVEKARPNQEQGQQANQEEEHDRQT